MPPANSSGRPIKHSLTLRGHRTSVSLEAAFWDAFCQIAAKSGQSLNDLAAEIDSARGDVGLASAIRVHVLASVQSERGVQSERSVQPDRGVQPERGA